MYFILTVSPYHCEIFDTIHLTEKPRQVEKIRIMDVSDITYNKCSHALLSAMFSRT